MVLLKLKCPPESRKAIVAVTVSTSSHSCSLNAPEDSTAPFQIILALHLENSTQPGRPITICTKGTVFAPSHPDGGLDTLALGTVGPLISSSDPKQRINLGQFKPHYLKPPGPPSANLKDRDGLHFLTIPADGVVEVRHDLPISRILRYEDTLTKDDLKVGEKYYFSISPGYLGTSWWCWGDLEDDLKGKKLSAWQAGINFEKAGKPTEEQIEKEGWVLGANPAELLFEDQTGSAEFTFVD
ncbi:MAG: hypothetical protein Q9168_006367 [Polycauliona sp. 1 TL-2023]